MVLASFNWQLEHINFTDFEVMFNTHVATLSYLGEITEVDELLDQYETTVSARDVRYIKYCEMRCVAYWQRSQFPDALDWGQRGEDLRKESDVDTKSDISHTLALVQRDSGRPEDALPEFLGGRRIEEVTDPQEFDENRSGPHYGNIGRCLQFMGQLDQALICFQKSAILLENRVQTNHVYNQGFIRKWLGEVFVARGQALLGGVFLRAAYLKWMETSPPRAVDAMSMYREIEGRRKELSEIGDREIEKTCLDWIFSRPLEAKYSS